MGVYDYQKELLRKTDTLEPTDSEYYRSKYLLGNSSNFVPSSDSTHSSLLIGILLAFAFGYLYDEIYLLMLEVWCVAYGIFM